MRRVAITALCCLVLRLVAAGQRPDTSCREMDYEDRNQVDYGPLKVAALQGIAKDSDGVVVPRVCIGIFTETEHKLIAATQTDSKGHFQLKGVPTGDYRLVAAYDGFSPANAKLRVERLSSGKLLAIQMRFAGVDSGSFIVLSE